MTDSRQTTTAPLIDCRNVEQRAAGIRRALELLRSGGLVVFPTETVYGVGASISSDRGLERLRAVKQRTDAQPFTLHLGSVEDIEQYVDVAGHPTLKRLIRRTMPGPITIIAEVDDAVAQAKLAEMGLPLEYKSRLYHDRTIGLRVPDDPVAAELLTLVGQPIAASSANSAGQPPPHDAATSARALGDQVDLILDGGHCRFAKPSTIVRVTAGRVEVLREGVYDRRYIEKLMRRSILFVCSGNTCRSPMAEAIARHELAQRLHIPLEELDSANWSVNSAGAFATAGLPLSPEASQALQQMGVKVTPHRSRPLTADMLRDAEVIYVMTESHRQAVAALLPDAVDKTHRLDPQADVEDPIGSGIDVYMRTAQRLHELIHRRLDELTV